MLFVPFSMPAPYIVFLLHPCQAQGQLQVQSFRVFCMLLPIVSWLFHWWRWERRQRVFSIYFSSTLRGVTARGISAEIVADIPRKFESHVCVAESSPISSHRDNIVLSSSFMGRRSSSRHVLCKSSLNSHGLSASEVVEVSEVSSFSLSAFLCLLLLLSVLCELMTRRQLFPFVFSPLLWLRPPFFET